MGLHLQMIGVLGLPKYCNLSAKVNSHIKYSPLAGVAYTFFLDKKSIQKSQGFNELT
jgi:hypothetical protein